MTDSQKRVVKLMRQCRDLLHAALTEHRRICPDGGACPEVINAIAWLCHTVGVGSQHLETLGKSLDQADARCKQHRFGETHRN